MTRRVTAKTLKVAAIIAWWGLTWVAVIDGQWHLAMIGAIGMGTWISSWPVIE